MPTGRSASSVPVLGTVNPSSRSRATAASCSASTSVGAMSAPWYPPCTAMSSAASATTVLPEPTSPCRSRCIGTGLARSPWITSSVVLVRGELVRQRAEEAREQLAVHLVLDAAALRLDRALAQHERDLDAEELVEAQPPLRLAPVLRDLGLVHVAVRPRAVGQVLQLGAQVVGERVGELAGEVERGGDRALDLPRRHVGLPRLRVDRHDDAGLQRRRRGRARRRSGSRAGACRGRCRASRTARPRCRPRAGARATAG